MAERIVIGGAGPAQDVHQGIALRYANRHGLVAGATGTGKTVTLQVMAEGFSLAGVPVFLADVKGDLAGMAMPGRPHPRVDERISRIGLDDYAAQGFPVVFWDLFGQKGHPVRTTVAELGPLLLARMLELNDTQEGILNVAFRVADEEGLPILDMKDLRALLSFVAEHAREISTRYGYVATASLSTIQRRLLVLEEQGGDLFLGEPALDLADMMTTAPDGRGLVNILAAESLMGAPRLYATFLLWLLSELFETLPEVGDPAKPKFVFFFDEAHLLFNRAPRALIEKVERVARLIRSKGVGVYFVTQAPGDVPDTVLGQLGNRVQHALRGFTAKDQRELRAAAQTYRPNPEFDTAEAVRDVGVGEAVTSFLEDKGAPGVVQRTLIRPPMSQMGPIEDAARATLMAASPVAGRYDTLLDRDSAHEMLARRAEAAAREAEASERAASAPQDAPTTREYTAARRYSPGGVKAPRAPERQRASSGDSVGTAFAKSFARSLGTRSGSAVARGVLGTLFRGR